MGSPRVCLVGLPGSGRSAVGRTLAQGLGWEFFDVADAAGLDGAFVGNRPAVLALATAVTTDAAAWHRLIGSSWVVWLDAADGVLLGRLAADATRARLHGHARKALEEDRRLRTPMYRQAHTRIDTDGLDIDAVAARLRAMIGRGFAQVALDSRSYPVLVAPGCAKSLPLHLEASTSRVVVLADRGVLPLARELAGLVRKSGRIVSVVALAGGERVKTWATAGRIHERLVRFGVGRDDAIVAVGGGTIGDLGGFVAATYHRGITLVHVPTTLLAMVDSAVGGKTGVNLPSGKNLAGAIWQPRVVLCDPLVLTTLPECERHAAFGEIIKYAMIAGGPLITMLDNDLASLLRGDIDGLTGAVVESVNIKARVVSVDERERGDRAILNYGHTVGHALETATGHGTLRHGEAVAIGMRVAGRLSVRWLGCPEDDIRWQDEMLRRCGLGIAPPIEAPAVQARLGVDKKAVAGRNRWVLLHERAQPAIGEMVDEILVAEAISSVLNRPAGQALPME